MSQTEYLSEYVGDLCVFVLVYVCVCEHHIVQNVKKKGMHSIAPLDPITLAYGIHYIPKRLHMGSAVLKCLHMGSAIPKLLHMGSAIPIFLHVGPAINTFAMPYACMCARVGVTDLLAAAQE